MTSRRQTVASDLSNLINTVKEQRTAHAEPADPPIPDALPEGVTVGESSASEPTSPPPREQPRPTALRESSLAPTSALRPTRGDVKKLVGKRSRIDYQMVGVYLRKSTVLAVKGALLATEDDMSELTEKLLTTWLETRKAGTTRARVDR